MEEQLLSRFFEKSPIPYAYQRLILDERGEPIDFEYLDLNAAMEQVLQRKETEVLGKKFRELNAHTDVERVESWIRICADVALNNRTVTVDLSQYWQDETRNAKLFALESPYFATILLDKTHAVLDQDAISGFLNSNLEMLCLVNLSGKFLNVNQAFEQTLGFSAVELIGHNILGWIHAEDIDNTRIRLKQITENNPVVDFLARFRHKDGNYRYVEWRTQINGDSIVASARDISGLKQLETELRQRNDKLAEMAEILQLSNQRLQTIAVTDELTGLYNRYYLDQRGKQEMERADRLHSPLSMLIMDMDHFKRVNDQYGHPVGDEVLKQTSLLTAGVIRANDVLARFGGEEFIVLLPDTDLEQAIVVGEKIRSALEAPAHLKAGRVTASIGVAERMRSESFKSCYKRADEALYQAKHSGRNRLVAFRMEELPVASVTIRWRQGWESGHPDIDGEHRELLDLANGLIELSLSSAKSQIVLEQLDRLLHHVVFHFESEEKVLEQTGYEGTLRHKRVHQALVTKAMKVKEEFLRGELKPSAFFSFVVDDVVIGHMVKEDLDFFPTIRQWLEKQ